MRYRFACLAAIINSVFARHMPAQTARPDPVGTWRGTSLCQVRPSACNDESVVFRITRTTARDSLALDGRKIVNAEEVEMGVLGCRLDVPSARLTCPIPDAVWLFTIRGDSLVGELRLSDGTKVREVRTARSGQAGRETSTSGLSTRVYRCSFAAVVLDRCADAVAESMSHSGAAGEAAGEAAGRLARRARELHLIETRWQPDPARQVEHRLEL